MDGANDIGCGWHQWNKRRNIVAEKYEVIVQKSITEGRFILDYVQNN